ncbi:hypothetical protein GO495_01510 [Chitinophaga oryziterrae]|uniref:Uncharacterized protein n=1 Tax=Chitinophaga oryziterrae TaxID=1031224 RepID=A0A6N8J204_9BACT|nr:hypothetical protein [Chitinophaga oryziterrae]MVT39247.1 hypothetical protein [Chitinophaga oryziterrae]
MKKYLPLLLLTLSIAACHQKTASNTSIDSTARPKAQPADIATDTFQMGNKNFLVYDMDPAESPFTEEPAIESDSAELTLLRHDKNGHVKRLGDSLIITLENGRHIVLASNAHPKHDDSYTEYTYTGYLPDIKQYGIFGTYYESTDFLLVDQTTGVTTHTWGAPIISPDKKYFLCPSYDLEAGFTANGFQLYSYVNGTITPVGEIELDNWGPGQVKWIDNNTFVAEHISLDSTMNKVIKPVKIVMQ